MHDIRAIRANPAAFDTGMARRGLPPAAERLLALDTERRTATTAVEEARAPRNHLSASGKTSTEINGLHSSRLDESIRALLETADNSPILAILCDW